ncbi:ATP-grasp domain-containing protein [Photobacterium sp. BZF1]|uniref:arsenate reductase/protein-tyrosine-phosphatase family protein n=1 Tax=Photobacterium sp. BZF1 TaxID=1904457 RepID=UPI001653B01D|nr:ATP-grasp domain-containing protein [Photobacterium sp. BZF1]MBC7003563.1 ATP-grasp domain-containing protein [Photobacterium sp. BZF1]
MDTKKVLILGEDTRSFLSVIRSLGKAGYEVHVVCYDRTSPSLKSKYITNTYYYNYQAYSHQEWLENVLALIERYQFDLVIPCDERAMYPLWASKDKMPDSTKLAIANQEALDVLFDKWETKKLAQECGIPVAKGKVVALAQYDYPTLQKTFGNEFVVKPLQSFDEGELHKRNRVVIVKSEGDYHQSQASAQSNDPFLVEAFFSGKGEGVSVFSINGELKAAFAYKRVAEPDSGGGSSYRESIDIDEELLSATESMCSRTNYTGVAMFEFRRNLTSREWILVEVNARFWGGLPLAIYAGVDFPRLYADYLCYGIAPQQIQREYKRGITARSLTNDLYEAKREFEKRAKLQGKLKALPHLSYRLAEYGKVLTPKETIDSLDIRDVKPYISELSLILKELSKPFFKNTIYTKCRRYVMEKKLRRLFIVNAKRRIIFVCYGNIMRSPFAEEYLNDKFHEIITKPQLDSYGFHLDEFRSSPETAIEAASQMDYDLSKHSSKCLTQLDIRDTDIIIFFDEKNRNIIEKFYRINHSFCAADLLDENDPLTLEIDDPYHGDVNTVSDCYDQIKRSVDNLMKIYRESTQ